VLGGSDVVIQGPLGDGTHDEVGVREGAILRNPIGDNNREQAGSLSGFSSVGRVFERDGLGGASTKSAEGRCVQRGIGLGERNVLGAEDGPKDREQPEVPEVSLDPRSVGTGSHGKLQPSGRSLVNQFANPRENNLLPQERLLTTQAPRSDRLAIDRVTEVLLEPSKSNTSARIIVCLSTELPRRPPASADRQHSTWREGTQRRSEENSPRSEHGTTCGHGMTHIEDRALPGRRTRARS
jgi:hypothetical protein